MKFWQKIVSITMALVLVLLGIGASSGNAAADGEFYKDDNIKASFEQMNELGKNSSELTNTKEIEKIKESTKRAVSNKKVVLNHPGGGLDFDNAKLLKISQKKKDYISITIPVNGEKYSLLSNMTFVYDAQNKIVNYTEALITKNKENKFVISTYLDGNLMEEDVTDLDFISNEEIKKGVEDIQKNADQINGKGNQVMGVGAVASCIGAVAGVNGVVAYLIAGTCIASCPAVVPICVACIAGVATIGAADVAAVVACFNLL